MLFSAGGIKRKTKEDEGAGLSYNNLLFGVNLLFIVHCVVKP